VLATGPMAGTVRMSRSRSLEVSVGVDEFSDGAVEAGDLVFERPDHLVDGRDGDGGRVMAGRFVCWVRVWALR
jgi:hypothetical protein